MPLELRAELPEFTAVCIEIPDDATKTEISIARLADLMTGPDPLAACQAAGDDWLAHGTDLILQAPSVLVPEDSNIMLNPTHPRSGEVSVVSSRSFQFDPRLAIERR
jgi:hypothetical protein